MSSAPKKHLCLLLLLCLLLVTLPILAEQTRVGIDLSAHSGQIDWSRFDRGRFAFVYLKASEGIDLQDGAFQIHWQTLAHMGVPRGAYHFFVTEDDPMEQARFFVSTLGQSPGDLPPVLDIELIGLQTKGPIAAKIQIWLTEVERVYGVKPIIYTSSRFWENHVAQDFSQYPLWVAEYGIDSPKLPGGWTDWSLWQFRENVALPWVEKGVDLSHIHPTLLETLQKKRTLKNSSNLK